MNTTPLPSRARLRTRGFSMVIVLIILAILSLLGVAATQVTLQTERSSRYDRDWQIAYQAAEAALLDAEFDIRGPNVSPANRVSLFAPDAKLGFDDGCGSGELAGLCVPVNVGKPVWYTVDFLDNSGGARTVEFGRFTGRTLDVGATGVRPARAPRYIIEVIDDPTPGDLASDVRNQGGGAPARKVLYRVTAIGFGPREDTQAVLQMYYRKEGV